MLHHFCLFFLILFTFFFLGMTINRRFVHSERSGWRFCIFCRVPLCWWVWSCWSPNDTAHVTETGMILKECCQQIIGTASWSIRQYWSIKDIKIISDFFNNTVTESMPASSPPPQRKTPVNGRRGLGHERLAKVVELLRKKQNQELVQHKSEGQRRGSPIASAGASWRSDVNPWDTFGYLWCQSSAGCTQELSTNWFSRALDIASLGFVHTAALARNARMSPASQISVSFF